MMTTEERAARRPGDRDSPNGEAAPVPQEQPATIALAIPWCPWIPERVESVRRLREALGFADFDGKRPTVAQAEAIGLVDYAEFSDRESNDVWSGKLFDFLADSGADWALQIQEDAEVPANFWQIVRAIFKALPPEAEIVGFHVCHPLAGQLFDDDVRLMTTADALVGVCWAMRRDTMRAFRDWRRTELVEGWREPVPGPGKGLPHLTEDTMIGCFALATGRKIWHPLPAIVDHDTSMKSVWGNDDHQNRRPVISWKDAAMHGHAWKLEDLEGPGFWLNLFKRVAQVDQDGNFVGYARGYNMDPAARARGRRHIGRFYEATPHLARRWVKGFDEGKFVAAMKDNGFAERRRLVHVQAARMPAMEPALSIMLCSPNRGRTAPEFNQTVWNALREQTIELVNGYEIVGARQWSEDIVRVRSRFARLVLEHGCDVMWNLDADVSHDHSLFRGMLALGRDFVCAPYPKRDSLDLKRVAAAGQDPRGRPPEAFAYTYNVTFCDESLNASGKGLAVDDRGCVEVAAMPLGCSMIRRAVLERMTEYYGEEFAPVDLQDAMNTHGVGRSVLVRRIEELVDEVFRWRSGREEMQFLDEVDGQARKTVALFKMIVGPELYGEDVSFCTRWRALGGKIFMYLGPGSPAVHHGELAYSGDVGAFGVTRKATLPR